MSKRGGAAVSEGVRYRGPADKDKKENTSSSTSSGKTTASGRRNKQEFTQSTLKEHNKKPNDIIAANDTEAPSAGRDPTTAVPATAAGPALPLVAPINWAQTKTKIYLSYMVGNVTDVEVELGRNAQSLTFSARDDSSLTNGNPQPSRYSTTIDLFGAVLPLAKKLPPRACLKFVRVEFEKVIYEEWDRLTVVPHRMVRNLVTYDWELHDILESDDEPSSCSSTDREEEEDLIAARKNNTNPRKKALNNKPVTVGSSSSSVDANAKENKELKAMVEGYKKEAARKKLASENQWKLLIQVGSIVGSLLLACLITLVVLWKVNGW